VLAVVTDAGDQERAVVATLLRGLHQQGVGLDAPGPLSVVSEAGSASTSDADVGGRRDHQAVPGVDLVHLE
jgi:hypothetical protein